MRARLSGPVADRRVYGKALSLLARFDRGEKVYTRLQGNGYLKINLGLRWRLLSRDNGQHWRLATHEKYNTLKGKK